MQYRQNHRRDEQAAKGRLYDSGEKQRVVRDFPTEQGHRPDAVFQQRRGRQVKGEHSGGGHNQDRPEHESGVFAHDLIIHHCYRNASVCDTLTGFPEPIMQKVIAFLVLACTLSFAQTPQLSPAVRPFVKYDQSTIALTHVRVIDGTGAAARENQTVVLSSGKIESVGESVPP